MRMRVVEEMVMLLTQEECADVLRLSERTLERYRVSGTGPRFIKCGRSIRYRSQDIEAWLASNTLGSTSEREARHGLR
jgi:predicted DNA-binding transcriptional regulator AlpA